MRTRPVLALCCGYLLGCAAQDDAGGGSSGAPGPSETGVASTGSDTGASGTAPTGSATDASSSTGSTDGSQPTSSESTGCSFICETTWENVGECDIFAQDCPDGQKCAPAVEGGGGSWNTWKCVPVTGDGAPRETCMAEGGGLSGVDDCAEGVMCWNVDEDGMGVCVGMCTGSPESPMCPDDISCSFSDAGVLYLCLPDCDPLLQDCPGDDLCIPNNDAFICVLDASGEGGQAHDVCEFANACDKGLVCLDSAVASGACDQAATGCCEPFCKFPDGACPAPDQQCVQWFDPRMLAMDDPKLAIGVCAIPK